MTKQMTTKCSSDYEEFQRYNAAKEFSDFCQRCPYVMELEPNKIIFANITYVLTQKENNVYFLI